MKKFLFLVAVTSVLSVFSCKKDYSCMCSNSVSNYNQSAELSLDTVVRTTRKNADKFCAMYNVKKKDGSDSVNCYSYTND